MALKNLTPAEIAAKQVTRTTNAIPDYVKGVQSVTTSPGVSAAKNIDKMRAKFNDAIDSGKTARRLQAIDLGNWQKATADKGKARIADGVKAASQTITDFHTQFRSHLEQGQQILAGMPSTTLQENIQRMVANVEHNAKFSFRK
jgi:hypothetical protein